MIGFKGLSYIILRDQFGINTFYLLIIDIHQILTLISISILVIPLVWG